MPFNIEYLFTDLLWQDAVLTVGQIFFVFALIPMIRATQKPPLITSITHGLILASFGVVFASLSLWFSTIAVFLASLMWLYLSWQRFSYKNVHR